MEKATGVPPKDDEARAGVSLAHPEAAFLALIASPFASEPEIAQAGRAVGLTKKNVTFVRDYLAVAGDKGRLIHEGAYSPADIQSNLTHLPTFKILEELAKADPQVKPPIPGRNDLILDWDLVRSNPACPETLRIEARKELAKLLGYYADKGGGGGAVVNIVVGDPYSGGVVINGRSNND